VYIIGFIDLNPLTAEKHFMKFLNQDQQPGMSTNHAMWTDPNHPGHLVIGNDGGVNITYDDGANWIKCNNPPVGQFVSVNYDMETPYNVYGGLQDNGVWMGPSSYNPDAYWHQTGQYPYKQIMDEMECPWRLIRATATTCTPVSKFGNYFKVNTVTNSTAYITPKHELGERPYRWNWNSPIWLSLHNQDIVVLRREQTLACT